MGPTAPFPALSPSSGTVIAARFDHLSPFFHTCG